MSQHNIIKGYIPVRPVRKTDFELHRLKPGEQFETRFPLADLKRARNAVYSYNKNHGTNISVSRYPYGDETTSEPFFVIGFFGKVGGAKAAVPAAKA